MSRRVAGGNKQVYLWVAVMAALALPWGVDSIGPVPAYVLNLGAIFAIVAVALNLLTGYSGQVSLGHAAFVMFGEYASALFTLKLGWPFWVAMPMSGVFVGVIGFLIGLPAVRLTGNFLAVATMGFGLAVPELVLKWRTLTNGSTGLNPTRPKIGNFTLGSDLYYYYLILFSLGIVLWISVSLLRSKTGRAFQAIRDSETAAVSVGINTAYYKALVFALSAAFTGIAGSLYAHYVNYISPGDFTIQDSFMFLAMIVVGGLASLPGAILGAFVLTIVNQVSSGLGQFSVILTGTVMILMVFFFPDGLVSLFRRRSHGVFRTRTSSTGVTVASQEVSSQDVS